MPRTHLSKRDERRNARARRKLYNRIFTIGIIVVILVIVAWLIWSSQKAKPVGIQTPTAGGSTPAAGRNKAIFCCTTHAH